MLLRVYPLYVNTTMLYIINVIQGYLLVSIRYYVFYYTLTKYKFEIFSAIHKFIIRGRL